MQFDIAFLPRKKKNKTTKHIILPFTQTHREEEGLFCFIDLQSLRSLIRGPERETGREKNNKLGRDERGETVREREKQDFR